MNKTSGLTPMRPSSHCRKRSPSSGIRSNWESISVAMSAHWWEPNNDDSVTVVCATHHDSVITSLMRITPHTSLWNQSPRKIFSNQVPNCPQDSALPCDPISVVSKPEACIRIKAYTERDSGRSDMPAATVQGACTMHFAKLHVIPVHAAHQCVCNKPPQIPYMDGQ